MSLAKLPKSLIVLGGGPVAIELAQFFARFNVKVTIVQRSRHILKACDDDAAETLEKVLRREGVALFTDTQIGGRLAGGALKRRVVPAPEPGGPHRGGGNSAGPWGDRPTRPR